MNTEEVLNTDNDTNLPMTNLGYGDIGVFGIVIDGVNKKSYAVIGEYTSPHNKSHFISMWLFLDAAPPEFQHDQVTEKEITDALLSMKMVEYGFDCGEKGIKYRGKGFVAGRTEPQLNSKQKLVMLAQIMENKHAYPADESTNEIIAAN